jgi:hypothetical protein
MPAGLVLDAAAGKYGFSAHFRRESVLLERNKKHIVLPQKVC